MRIHFLIPLLALPFILSCTGKNQQSAVSIDTTFVNFYADRMILHEELKINNADSIVVASRMDSLYRFYKLSQENAEKRTEAYKQDLTVWKLLHDQVVRRLEQLQLAKPAIKDIKK